MDENIKTELRRKHPLSQLEIPELLPEMPYLIIAQEYVVEVARRIQDGFGPGGTDATHWRDVNLLRVKKRSPSDSYRRICIKPSQPAPIAIREDRPADSETPGDCGLWDRGVVSHLKE
eukprot:GHVR01151424.1.p1 GENE.GHVR01151424.1~~GHVR01151424.1.p1  ORF type:complete len:118 (+),score=8.17 GHVR01151424.1:226-579(+)